MKSRTASHQAWSTPQRGWHELVAGAWPRRAGWCTLACCFLLWAAGANAAEKPADLVLTNAHIYTENAHQPWAEALAVRDGQIVAVGSSQQVAAYRGEHTQMLDGGGRLVLPGFTDCHVHFMGGALALQGVKLDDAKTVAEIQKRVKEFAAAHPERAWILGRGWSYDAFGEKALPDKKFLDEVVPDRPVLLRGYDGHTSWVNSKALEKAGITRDTPDPPNGIIVRDPKTGEATGALKEHASALVDKAVPQPTRAERLQALRAAIREANQAGLVRVHSAGGDFEYLDLYDELRQKGELTLRFYISYFLDPPELTAEQIEKVEQARKTYHDDWIAGGAVKTMLDGVVESHTAAMLEPYSDDPSVSGKLFWDPAKYKSAVLQLNQRGFQVFTHSIGTLAVRTALDAFEAAERAGAGNDLRDRVEHIETIAPQDIPRFGKLGVIASMQPLHSYPDADTLQVWARNAGPARVEHAWPWREILNGGGKLAFGSDWPVVTLSPWPGVQTALTRQTRQGNPPGGWVPQERISLPEIIRAYTLDAAFAGHREQKEGSLEPGKLADFIVLDKDLFKIPANQTSDEKVLLTVVGGKAVYQAPEWTGAVKENK